MYTIEPFPEVACTVGALRALPLRAADDGLHLHFTAQAGLHQFSVVADAADFDWEELYEDLTKYHNTGQRTGPWDFKLGPNTPLVPTYWVYLNGRKLGLWHWQRVSFEDLVAKRFRGRMAFDVPEAGDIELRLVPYREFKLRWVSASLETDPDDVLESLTVRAEYSLPAQQWADPTFWARNREQLATTHRQYHEPLQRSFAWALARENPAPDDIMLLLAAWRLGKVESAREMLLRALDSFIELPHWGNPQKDGYSHDGDMHAAAVLRVLAWCWHALEEELGEERRQRLLEKLALQGERFFTLALLNRDYWGGSVLQDHGWKSTFAFGAAVLNLIGVLPQAERWAAWIVPRARRSVQAMPRDGVVPASSHRSLQRYVVEPTYYRDALLALTGSDLFEEGPFHEIVNYVALTAPSTPHLLLGGNAFFNAMAAKYDDPCAALLQKMLLERPLFKFTHTIQEQAFYQQPLWGFLTYDPTMALLDDLPAPRALEYFADSGLVQYHDETGDLTFRMQCGPWVGHHSEGSARGPCDRMAVALGAGHFEIRRGATPLLMTPESGYALHSALCSVLLVDDKGQYGSIGYPMSIPAYRHRGEEILFARWNEETRCGHIRLDLAPAYPDELQLAVYTRDFLLESGRIIIRDHVVLQHAGELNWLFQGRVADGLKKESETRFRFGKERALGLEAKVLETELRSRICPTEVVWSHSSASDFTPFDHVRFTSAEPVEKANAEFVLTWDF